MDNSPCEPAIVKPVKLQYTPDVGTAAVMAATHPDIKMLRNTTLFKGGMSRHLFAAKLYIGSGATKRFCMAGPFVGAPYGVMILETLIAWGVRRIVFWGWCGTISAKVRIGDIIVPLGAISDEGTSKHYPAIRGEITRPSDMMVHKIRTALAANDTDFHEGLIWTTDGVFRETKEKVLFYRSKGALAVEMELSALYTVAAFHRVDLGGILVVSDDLSDLTWNPGFKSEQFGAGRMAAGQAVQTLCRELS